MIDSRAIIEPGAKIANNVEIGPFSIIGKDVEIGEGTQIGPHVVIEGHTKIGKNNKFYQFACIGGVPQHKKYAGEDTLTEIGDENVFREFCTIHRGTIQGRGVTKIGNGNFIMNYVHIAHDCVIGNETIFTNNASLAGHVVVGNYVNLGGFAKVVQFCTLGDYCFVAGATDIAKDVPPYLLVGGYYEHLKIYGLNTIGLKRHGFSEETLKYLDMAYQIIYRQNLTTQQAIPELEKLVPQCKEVQLFIDMLRNSKRGIIRK
jgi:UDP-N-acetylglucosamine acyltransferase